MLSLTDQMLMDQMCMTEREIRRRKALLGLSDDDARLLSALMPLVTSRVDDVVTEFYDAQMKRPEVTRIIGGSEGLTRLHGTMRAYVMDLFSGHYGADYVNSRLRIGLIHHRIGVTPQLYLAAVNLLQGLLVRAIDGNRDAVADGTCARHKEALRKLLMFDMALVFDTYIHTLVGQVDHARQEMERYASTLEDKVADRTRQLHELARRDSLTGLYNQATFYELLSREVEAATRYRHALCLAYIDLNRFKAVNDRYGHRTGDTTLALVGRTILETVRSVDFPCRYGGDEFSLVLPHTDTVQALELCRRLIKRFDESDTEDVTLSIGIAQIGPERFVDTDTLVQWADARMYVAKQASRTEPGHHIQAPLGEAGPAADRPCPAIVDRLAPSLRRHHKTASV